jgi:hypothetical protein
MLGKSEDKKEEPKKEEPEVLAPEPMKDVVDEVDDHIA